MIEVSELEMVPDQGSALATLDVAVEVVVATTAVSVGVARRLVSLTAPISRPVLGVALHPPLLDERYHPATMLGGLARRGQVRRTAISRDLMALLDIVVPAVTTALIARMDLTEMVRRYVDLDGLVAGVDIDGIAAQLDLDAVVERLDLNAIVREQVDLDGLVGGVDIDAIAARIDIEAVINRIDLVSLVEVVIAEIDLPEIIRESSGSMASETVRGVRMQGFTADEALGRAVDRFRPLKSRRRHVVPPIEPDTSGSVDTEQQ